MIMKNKVLTLLLSMLCICNIYAEDDKIPIPPDQKWSDTNDRDNSSPELYQSESSVYAPPGRRVQPDPGGKPYG